jgi:hypothetical protein
MSLSFDCLARIVRDRLLFGRLAGLALWLGWVVSLALGGWTVDARGHRLGADHVQYYVVGQLVNEGRAGDVYDLRVMDDRQKAVGGPDWQGVLPFRYPPFYALVFAPTSRLPYEASWAIWTALGLLALGLALWTLEGRLNSSTLGWAFCFFPVFTTISFGQNALFSLAILAGAYGLLVRGRLFLAGLVGGLLLYKPTLLVGVGLLWVLQVRRRWLALLGLALTGAVLVGLAWLLIPDAVERFRTTSGQNVASLDQRPLAHLYSTQGFWSLLLPGRQPVAQGLSLGCSLLAAGALGLLWWRYRGDEESLFAAAVTLTLLISPYAMVYDWSILLLPAVVLGARRPAERDRWDVVFALVWLVALLSSSLVLGQLSFSPVAVQISVPGLVLAVALGWPGSVRQGRTAAWGGPPDRPTLGNSAVNPSP